MKKDEGLELPAKISIGCQTPKKFSAVGTAAISGRQCIYRARSISPTKTLARTSSNSSRNPLARILKWCFAFSRFQHSNALLDVRQSNRKRETFVLAALDGKFPAMLAHNATDD
jgi:late competence protein required for DNA uptake (superfamily II DNA/RNA helicase)